MRPRHDGARALVCGTRVCCWDMWPRTPCERLNDRQATSSTGESRRALERKPCLPHFRPPLPSAGPVASRRAQPTPKGVSQLLAINLFMHTCTHTGVCTRVPRHAQHPTYGHTHAPSHWCRTDPDGRFLIPASLTCMGWGGGERVWRAGPCCPRRPAPASPQTHRSRVRGRAAPGKLDSWYLAHSKRSLNAVTATG